jgi:release factor glutamine methyltransferase
VSAERWTIAKILASIQGYLTERGIELPRLDAEVLVAHVLKRDRIYLYTHFDQPLSEDERAALRTLTRRRGAREPIAYLVGQQEFFGRTFTVSPDVLIPRPETEHVVEAALSFLRHGGPRPVRLCDVGTGSGALAVTLAAEWPEAEVVAIDVSPAALAQAQANAQAHGVADKITWVLADVLTPKEPSAPEAQALATPFDVIVSNPPYIRDGDHAGLQPEVGKFEPKLALTSGVDGLDVMRRLCAALPRALSPQGFFAAEMGHDQAEAVLELLRPHLPHTAVVHDLSGHERVATGWFDPSFAGPVAQTLWQPSKAGETELETAPEEDSEGA